MKVYKYILKPVTTLTLPFDYKFLCVLLVDGIPQLYCMVNPEEKRTVNRTIHSINTGENVGDSLQYIDSFVTDNNIVWHVFYETEKEAKNV